MKGLSVLNSAEESSWCSRRDPREQGVAGERWQALAAEAARPEHSLLNPEFEGPVATYNDACSTHWQLLIRNQAGSGQSTTLRKGSSKSQSGHGRQP